MGPSIREHLLYEFKSEAELTRAIEELSIKFTTQRENIEDYLRDPRLASAYTAFYVTTNMPKLEAVFKWMPQEWLELIRSAPFVDLGAGPGTFGLAYKAWGGSGAVYQIEKSQVMREQARKLWDGLYGEGMKQVHERAIPGSLLLFGHSANEMGAEAALNYISKIDPGHILFIEPGTKSFFPEMLKIRRELIARGFNVLFPCPGAGECPMGPDDWCHQFVRVSHSMEVERLSQLAKKDRRLLPLTVHAYSKTFRHSDRERIVRVLPETKFSYEWEVCLGDKIEHFQVMKRGLEKKTQKKLESALSGDSIETREEKALENGKRVGPIKINNFLI